MHCKKVAEPESFEKFQLLCAIVMLEHHKMASGGVHCRTWLGGRQSPQGSRRNVWDFLLSSSVEGARNMSLSREGLRGMLQ